MVVGTLKTSITRGSLPLLQLAPSSLLGVSHLVKLSLPDICHFDDLRFLQKGYVPKEYFSDFSPSRFGITAVFMLFLQIHSFPKSMAHVCAICNTLLNDFYIPILQHRIKGEYRNVSDSQKMLQNSFLLKLSLAWVSTPLTDRSRYWKTSVEFLIKSGNEE